MPNDWEAGSGPTPEEERERLIDRRVLARLKTDRDYLFAENPEAQALAERKIELQEERAVLLSGHHTPYVQVRVEDIDAELADVIEELSAL